MSDIKKTGFFFKEPTGNTPDFIKSKVSGKVADAIAFLQSIENENGYFNLDLKLSKDGKFYFQENNWRPGGNDVP
jgi:hypothetical protein